MTGVGMCGAWLTNRSTIHQYTRNFFFLFVRPVDPSLARYLVCLGVCAQVWWHIHNWWAYREVIYQSLILARA